MALLNWVEDYSVGVKEFDEQHKKMFVIINNLYDAMHASVIDDELREFINELVSYANYHFSTEEKYFAEFDYPEKEAHIKAHDFYRAKVSEFVKEFEEHKKFLSFEILDFLEDWWLGHVITVDKKYTSFFNAHGLQAKTYPR